MNDRIAAIEAHLRTYRPRLPANLDGGNVRFEVRGIPAGDDRVRDRFPRTFGRPLLEPAGAADGADLRLGVVLSGGQAPGGHNVIAGVLDGALASGAGSTVIGFLGGPRGVIRGHYRELGPELVDDYRNSGGFDMIGSGRDKIESAEQLADCARNCSELRLDGLVVIGGDDSNTNAAVIAEHFAEQGVATRVQGVPKTIDGDLRGEHVELSFGFDTATRVYAELIGNIARDARSAGKYWHFIKLMGRSASHVTLECALQTHPNVTLIGEEVLREGSTLEEIVDGIAAVVRRRGEAGLQHGVVLVPEGLIEFIPEMRTLIDELNRKLSDETLGQKSAGQLLTAFLNGSLSSSSRRVFASLPDRIQQQLLLERDSHGNVQVSLIETEALLLGLVQQRLQAWGKLKAQRHFLGYEGRCSYPTRFDAEYTYSLGRLAVSLAAGGHSGYLCSVRNLAAPVDAWEPVAVPLTSMLHLEERKGEQRPVIAKALVDLDGPAFGRLREQRNRWAEKDDYRYPGPIQYFGPDDVVEGRAETLKLERPASG